MSNVKIDGLHTICRSVHNSSNRFNRPPWNGTVNHKESSCFWDNLLIYGIGLYYSFVIFWIIEPGVFPHYFHWWMGFSDGCLLSTNPEIEPATLIAFRCSSSPFVSPTLEYYSIKPATSCFTSVSYPLPTRTCLFKNQFGICARKLFLVFFCISEKQGKKSIESSPKNLWSLQW